MRKRYKHYLISFLLQVVIAGFFLHPWDGFVVLRSVQDFLHGVTPYEAAGKPYAATLGMGCWYAYPPLPLLLFTSTFAPYYHLDADNLILGRIFLKLSIILGNLLCAYLTYRLVSAVSTPQKASKAERLILYNPFLFFIGAAWGMFDIWVMNFLLLCLLRLRQGQIVRAGIFLALSLLVKPIAVVFVPVIVAYVWNKNRGITKPVAFVSAIGITSVVVCLPFYLISSDAFLQQVVGQHAARPPGGCSPLMILYLGKVLQEMRSVRVLFLPLPSISAISLGLVALTSIALFLYLRLRREIQEKELFAALFLAMLFFTLFSKVVNPQYFVTLMVLSLLLLYAYDNYAFVRRSLVKKYYLSLAIPFLLAQFFEGRHFLLFIPADIATWLFGKTAGQLDTQFAQSSPYSPDFYYVACQIAFILLILPTLVFAFAIVFPSLREIVISVSKDAVKSLPRTWLTESRGSLQKSLAILIAVSLLAVPAAAGAVTYEREKEQPTTYPEPLGARSVGAFYYYWWDNSSRNPDLLYDNWTKAGLTPEDGYYQPNIEYMKEDIRQMKQAGIDFAVVSFPDYQIRTERYAAFVDASEEESFYFAPMIEAYDLDVDRPQIGAEPFNPDDKIRDKLVKRFCNALEVKGSSSILRLDGKPVVFVHTRPYFPAEADFALDQAFWSETLAEVESKKGDLFLVRDLGPEDIWEPGGPFDAGFHLPTTFWQDAGDEEEALQQWQARMNALVNTDGSRSIATVMPYYNDLKMNPQGQEIPTDIDGQSTYDRFWEIAIGGQPDIVLIFSWNEYFESACIEPTREFGDEFLQRTGFWTGEFKKT